MVGRDVMERHQATVKCRRSRRIAFVCHGLSEGADVGAPVLDAAIGTDHRATLP